MDLRREEQVSTDNFFDTSKISKGCIVQFKASASFFFSTGEHQECSSHDQDSGEDPSPPAGTAAQQRS